MNQSRKIKAFQELFNLLLFYSENRDRPKSEDFNFFKEIEFYCKELDLDVEEFKATFGLHAAGKSSL